MIHAKKTLPGHSTRQKNERSSGHVRQQHETSTALPNSFPSINPYSCDTNGPFIFPTPPEGCGPKPPPHPTVTTIPPEIIEAWQKLPLVPPNLFIQPPSSKSALVNVPLIAFTTSPESLDWRTIILGREITIHTYTLHYRWTWGDGQSTVTKDPGAAWPKASVTHVFTSAGRYPITVSQIVGATWQAPGGVPQPIPSTLALTSAPQWAQLVEKRAVLVSHP